MIGDNANFIPYFAASCNSFRFNTVPAPTLTFFRLSLFKASIISNDEDVFKVTSTLKHLYLSNFFATNTALFVS